MPQTFLSRYRKNNILMNFPTLLARTFFEFQLVRPKRPS